MIAKLKIAVSLGMILFMIGCHQVIKPRTYSIHDVTQPDNFKREIQSLNEQKKITSSDTEKAQIHLKLAALYSHYKNPNTDYSRALKELREYITLDPEGGKRTEIQNWLAILQTLKRERKTKESFGLNNRKLKSEVTRLEKLKSEIDRLENEKKLMKETIEKLKHLDIRLEEKRKQELL
jgi:hypothetical protein